MAVAKKFIFEGRVQGVGFRFTCMRIADNYDVTGYVRNIPDGTVEMLLQGDESEITQLIERVKDYFQSNITNTKAQQTQFNPEYTDFKITF
jgi:acylphosphatase